MFIVMHVMLLCQVDEPDLPPEEKKKKAQEVSTSRVLSQEEFEMIQRRQAQKEVEGAKSSKKRKHVEIEDDVARYVGVSAR